MTNGRHLVVLFVVWSVGCAGQHSQLVRQNGEQAAALDKLRVSARYERQRVRDLERRLALELARRPVETRSTVLISSETVASDRPDLPVEVLGKPHQSASVAEQTTDFQIVGQDSEGYDIVYVGDAVSDNAIKLPSLPSGPARHQSKVGKRRMSALPPRTAFVHTLEPIAAASERTRADVGPVPTITNQLKKVKGMARDGTRARPTVDLQQEYRRYYMALQAGNHSSAIAGFRNFIDRFPAHDLADNAQYWLAEALYDQKKYKKAGVEFQRVVDQYPKGNKVPDAMLKLGYCHYHNGEIEDARGVWQAIVRSYPQSDPARLAKTKLVAVKE